MPEAAAKSLGRLWPASRLALIAALNHPRRGVREAVTKVFVNEVDCAAIPLLLTKLKDPDLSVRAITKMAVTHPRTCLSQANSQTSAFGS